MVDDKPKITLDEFIKMKEAFDKAKIPSDELLISKEAAQEWFRNYLPEEEDD